MHYSHNNSKQSGERGFTLIEIMAAVAVLAVLMALVIPAFQSYMLRTKVTDLKSVAYGARLIINDHVRTYGALPTAEDNLNLNPQTPSRFLEQVSWDESVLTIQGDPGRLGLKDGDQFTLIYEPDVRSGNVEWKCTALAPNSLIIPRGCEDGGA